MKNINIKKIDNKEINLLGVLKALYMDGSEINSIEMIQIFNDRFKEKGEISIKLSDEAFQTFEGYFKNELKYDVN